ncbi:MAG: 30S ribosomal protein S12 methylthiotransferase RimO [Gammaproteobacteria bacterium]|nr:MAG: 30S ribosomal protein S12 methylthiotransferase RimO [Gammaproteobacteria bacterium]
MAGVAALSAHKVGFVSLGCPKALVDSEQIVTRARAEGYEVVGDYGDADVVVVNTCGFIDSAVEESLDAIGEALSENGKVIVTGCLGARREVIEQQYPDVLAITGPHAAGEVMDKLRQHLPQPADVFTSLIPPQGLKLTPPHYAYLKISEGCNHRCSFCIIPSLRGDLVSRPIGDVLQEAENLAASGVKELLVISQDTSAYGVDLKYRSDFWRGSPLKTDIVHLAEELGKLGVWVRLHYVYPYPTVDRLIPLMAEGKILPYLDVPLQHASPRILKAMKRPANAENALARIRQWREICPDITLRSTFVVGFPGETEQDFQQLLDFLEQAQLDRVGCFIYSPVEGAAANALPDPVPEDLAQDRMDRLMALQADISARRLSQKVGQTLRVLVDGVDGDGRVVARGPGDAPEIDGVVYAEAEPDQARPGDWLDLRITHADAYDLFGVPSKNK